MRMSPSPPLGGTRPFAAATFCIFMRKSIDLRRGLEFVRGTRGGGGGKRQKAATVIDRRYRLHRRAECDGYLEGGYALTSAATE